MGFGKWNLGNKMWANGILGNGILGYGLLGNLHFGNFGKMKVWVNWIWELGF